MSHICDICVQDVPGQNREKIFAMGECDHHVCYVCSSRLRVICDQFGCPICRKKLDYVIFTNNRKSLFEKFNTKNCIYNDRYKIYFENATIKNSFQKLFQYECLECLKSQAPAIEIKKGKGPNISSGTSTAANNKKNTSNSDQRGTTNEVTPQTSNGSDADKRSRKNQRKKDKAPDRSADNGNTTAKRIEEDGQGLLDASNVIKNVFPDVFGLKNHLNYVHKLRLCDLCLTHNKLFPFEYSYYDSASLRQHIVKGEPNTSHKGHPSCDLCHHTLFNIDELIQHMRREHFHCHLCDSPDSEMQIYFLDYNSLRRHFKKEHFLCERDNCKHEQFTSAFDSLIDYQLHLNNAHGQHFPSIQISSAPHREQRAFNSAQHNQPRRTNDRNAAIVSIGPMATANNAANSNNNNNSNNQNIQIVRPQRLPTQSEFPALGQDVATLPTQTSTSARAQATSSIRPQPSTLSQRLASGSSGVYSRPPAQLSDNEFPPLPERPKPKSSNSRRSNQRARRKK